MAVEIYWNSMRNRDYFLFYEQLRFVGTETRYIDGMGENFLSYLCNSFMFEKCHCKKDIQLFKGWTRLPSKEYWRPLFEPVATCV